MMSFFKKSKKEPLEIPDNVIPFPQAEDLFMSPKIIIEVQKDGTIIIYGKDCIEYVFTDDDVDTDLSVRERINNILLMFKESYLSGEACSLTIKETKKTAKFYYYLLMNIFKDLLQVPIENRRYFAGSLLSGINRYKI